MLKRQAIVLGEYKRPWFVVSVLSDVIRRYSGVSEGVDLMGKVLQNHLLSIYPYGFLPLGQLRERFARSFYLVGLIKGASGCTVCWLLMPYQAKYLLLLRRKDLKLKVIL